MVWDGKPLWENDGIKGNLKLETDARSPKDYARPKIADVREVMQRIDREKRAKDVSPLLREHMKRMEDERKKELLAQAETETAQVSEPERT